MKGTGVLIKTYGLVKLGDSTMHPKEFFSPDNWKGFGGHVAEEWSRWFYSYLPDSLNPWLDLPRIGKYHIYDPLALDLNGNGTIDIIGIDGYHNALFDHDGDGIATATTWVDKQDGLLVLDKNNDGIINDGTELFGDSTKINGRLAKHGFEALASLDDNRDGVIDSKDKAYHTLQVWQDKNTNGISEQGELSTLIQLGIHSLSLSYTPSETLLDMGVGLAYQSTYTQHDKKYLLVDLQFTHNSIYSRHLDTLPLSAAQQKLPNLKGMGKLRDLRQATALSDKLTDLLTQYQLAPTKAAQLTLLPLLIKAWSDTDPDKYNTLTFSTTMELTKNLGIGLTPTQAAQLNKVTISPTRQNKLTQIKDKVAILDSFAGSKTHQIYVRSEQEANEILGKIKKRQNHQKIKMNSCLNSCVYGWVGV